MRPHYLPSLNSTPNANLQNQVPDHIDLRLKLGNTCTSSLGGVDSDLLLLALPPPGHATRRFPCFGTDVAGASVSKDIVMARLTGCSAGEGDVASVNTLPVPGQAAGVCERLAQTSLDMTSIRTGRCLARARCYLTRAGASPVRGDQYWLCRR